MKKIIGLGLVFFLVMGMVALSKLEAKDIKISLREKRIEGLHPGGLNLVFYINISNSSSTDYYLSGYYFSFVVEEKEYLQINRKLDSSLKINALDETLISLPVKITYKHLFQALPGVTNQNSANCYLRGGVFIAKHTGKKGHAYPLAFSAEFPLLKKPEIEFIFLKVNTLTLAGADLNLMLKVKSQNSFKLLVDRIRYRVELNRNPVGKGTIKGDKNIQAMGEKEFFLPLLLNFFEVGNEVKPILHQDSAICSFSGEIETRTVWGRVVFNFDKTEEIPITKD